MWPLIVQLGSQFGRRYIIFPIAVVCGSIGYLLETSFSDRSTPALNDSIADVRVGRMIQSELSSDPTIVDSLKEKKFVPSTIFEKNVSPSLQRSN
ncbi:hypothetical protein ONE63_007893 [Megalurothrips usitatus]|uniref:Small integral membrane protein 12-A n=1 Tax=Megalurothrips usitatus TaxID=439358 RepID=A0AAV7XQ66_9NEOP|nr:hypothetical protein ONE63_007893 [Megalurothrips usitatus]